MSATASRACKSKSILLIEDSDDDALLFAEAVKKAKLVARIERAENGRQAIDYIKLVSAKEAWPDLIFVDWNMPDVGGCEFLRWLRSQQCNCTSVVVVLTATERPHDLRNIMALSVVHWVKPATPEKLRTVTK